MSDTTRSYLKNLLATRYAHWVRRFERLAGSKDRAADLLHETWLRLESVQVTSSVENDSDRSACLGQATSIVCVRGQTIRPPLSGSVRSSAVHAAMQLLGRTFK